MIYKSKIGDIDLSKVIRLYPAAVIEVNGETAEMSLEWIEVNEDKVSLKHYALVFDFTQRGDETRDKKVLVFKTKDELFEEMQEVAKFFQD